MCLTFPLLLLVGELIVSHEHVWYLAWVSCSSREPPNTLNVHGCSPCNTRVSGIIPVTPLVCDSISSWTRYHVIMSSCHLLSCQRSLVDMYKVSATRYEDPWFESRAGQKIWIFSLFSSFFFLHVYFNVLSVLSVPTSQNTEILSRFPTIKYWILTRMGSKDRFNLKANFVV